MLRLHLPRLGGRDAELSLRAAASAAGPCRAAHGRASAARLLPPAGSCACGAAREAVRSPWRVPPPRFRLGGRGRRPWRLPRTASHHSRRGRAARALRQGQPVAALAIVDPCCRPLRPSGRVDLRSCSKLPAASPCVAAEEPAVDVSWTGAAPSCAARGPRLPPSPPSAFPPSHPLGDRGSWRRRPSPAAARASCSSLSILLLSSRAVKQPTLGVSAASAVSWCRRNGCGDRHRIGAPRRAAAIFSALSADAAVTSARLDELPSYYARPRREHALGVHCRGGLCLRQLQMVRRPKSSRRTRCSRSTQL